MGQPEIYEWLKKEMPDFVKVIDYWNRTQLGAFNLTSVGIAIACANLKEYSGNELDLTCWI